MYAVFDIESNNTAGLSNLVFVCERLFYFFGADTSSCSWISNQLVSVSLISRLASLNIDYNYVTGSFPFGITDLVSTRFYDEKKDNSQIRKSFSFLQQNMSGGNLYLLNLFLFISTYPNKV